MSSSDRRAFFESGRWLSNSYDCDCGAFWTGYWSCVRDTDCPVCGAAVSPSDSEDHSRWAVDEWGLPPRGLAPDVPEEVEGPRRVADVSEGG